jgi:hypothetical protein
VGGVFWYSGRHLQRSAGARAGFAVAGGLWSLLAGLSGVILAGLWLFTDHSAAYRNENLFQFSPLALPLVVLLPLAAYGRGRALRVARTLAALLVALGIAGILFKLVPGTRQVNSMLIALALPANLGLWVGLRDARAPRSPEGSGSPKA